MTSKTAKACNEPCWQKQRSCTLRTVTWLQSNHYPIFMAFTGAPVISLTSYPYTGKLPGCFSYKWPGYEARYKGTTQDHCHPGQPYHAHNTLLIGQYGTRIVTYCSVVKLWFTLSASARTVAPESPIPFHARLWKRVLQN